MSDQTNSRLPDSGLHRPPHLATQTSLRRSATIAGRTGGQTPSPLMPTLNRPANATSRQNLPPRPYDSHGHRSTRSVSTAATQPVRRMGLTSSGSWTDDRYAQQNATDDEDMGPALPRPWPTLDVSDILYSTSAKHPEPFSGYRLLVLNLAAVAHVPVAVPNGVILATVLHRLNRLVGVEGEGEYALIVLAAEEPATHGQSGIGREGIKPRSLPGLRWWAFHWKKIPHKYRKNLKRLYMVHASTLTRNLLLGLVPFLSPKVHPKIHIVPSLIALARAGIPLKDVHLPLSTLQEEAQVLRDKPEAAVPKGGLRSFGLAPGYVPQGGVIGTLSSNIGWGVTALTSAIGSASSYLPFSSWRISSPGMEQLVQGADAVLPPKVTSFWGRDIDAIVVDSGGRLPKLLSDLRATILALSSHTEGIFRRSPKSHLLEPLQAFLDLPVSFQPHIDWTSIAREDPLLPPIVLKRLIRALNPPIFRNNMYPTIRRTHTAEEIRSVILPSLSVARGALVMFITHLAHHLLPYEEHTRMSALALAIVLAGPMISGPNPHEDAAMCMEPGKDLPPQLLPPNWADGDDGSGQTLVGLLTTWIDEWPTVAEYTVSEKGYCECHWADGQGTEIAENVPRNPFEAGGSSGRRSA